MANTVEIVYPVCCGMDVHKSFVVACIAVTDERSHTQHHIKRFSTFTGDLRRLADWLASFGCRDVCMESAGKYWIPVFNALEKTCNVCLTHPKYVKAIKGKKTDKKDAKWIAELFKCDLVRSSFIPPANCATCAATMSSSQASFPARRIAPKTVLPLATSNWTMCSPTSLAKAQPVCLTP